MAHRYREELVGKFEIDDVEDPPSERTGRRGFIGFGAALLFNGVPVGLSSPPKAVLAEEDAHGDWARMQLEGRATYGRYEITVDGTIAQESPTTDVEAAGISGACTEGVIGVGTREFRFTGNITNVILEGDVKLLVNGRPRRQEILNDRSDS